MFWCNVTRKKKNNLYSQPDARWIFSGKEKIDDIPEKMDFIMFRFYRSHKVL